MAVAVEHVEQADAVLQRAGVGGTAGGDRVMVQHDQRGPRGVGGEHAVELGQPVGAQPTRVRAGHGRVQEQDAPAPSRPQRLHPHGAAGQLPLHRRGVVVVAGHEEHRRAQPDEQRLEPAVLGLRPAGGEIARGQDRVGRGASARMVQHRAERGQRIDAQERHVGPGGYVTIGDLHQVHDAFGHVALPAGRPRP
jgi:hypothetical protein